MWPSSRAAFPRPAPCRPARVTDITAEAAPIAARIPQVPQGEFDALLGRLEPRVCVDVATGRGESLRALIAICPSCSTPVGFDSSLKALRASRAQDPPAGLPLAAGDASAPPFRPGSADLVSIVNSLHHFERPSIVLDRAAELLRPGGSMLVVEMYRDGQRGPSMTHVLMHSWWGRIDRMNGIPHFDTLTRAAMHRLLSGHGLRLAAWTDDGAGRAERTGCGALPPGAEEIGRIEAIIDSYTARIPGGAPGACELAEEGERLRRRAARIGFAPSASLRLLMVRDA